MPRAGEKQVRVSVGNAKPSRGAPQPVRATEVKKPSVGSTFAHTVCRMLCRHKAAGQRGPLNTPSTTPATRERIPAQTQRTKSAAWSHGCGVQMACLSGINIHPRVTQEVYTEIYSRGKKTHHHRKHQTQTTVTTTLFLRVVNRRQSKHLPAILWEIDTMQL